MPTDDNSIDRDGQEQNPNGADTKYKPADLESAQKIIAALEKRLNERDGTISGLNERIGAIEMAQRQKLEQDGNFKELAAQRAAELEALKPKAQREAELDAAVREILTARLAMLPEVMRKLVPAEYSPEKQLRWIAENEGLLKIPPPPDFDAGKGGGKGTGSSAPELTATELEFARQAGITPERYLEMKKAKDKPIS